MHNVVLSEGAKAKITVGLKVKDTGALFAPTKPRVVAGDFIKVHSLEVTPENMIEVQVLVSTKIQWAFLKAAAVTSGIEVYFDEEYYLSRYVPIKIVPAGSYNFIVDYTIL